MAERVGRGMLIRATFYTVFRGYWHGTQRLFADS